MSAVEPDAPTPTATYKTILQTVIANRPSGVRQRLAQALGKNKSFISQITNPAYDIPIPAAHLDQIFDICHFSAEERVRFLAAYGTAHPRRLHAVRPKPRRRQHMLDLPDLGSVELNSELDALIDDFAEGLARLLARRDTRATPTSEDAP